MACYVNGQPSGNVAAHGSPAACSKNGGTWVDEPSLMKEESTIGDGELQWSDVGSFFRDPTQGAKDYWKGNTASDIALDVGMLAMPGGMAARSAWQGGKALLKSGKAKSLFDKAVDKTLKKDKNILSKGKGKTPEGQPVPMYKGGKPVLTKKGKPVYQTERVIDPMKVGMGAALTAGGVGKLFEDRPAPAPAPTTTTTKDPKEQGMLSNLFEGAKDIYGNIDWNQLSELGELIAYYNTPNAKRGEHPEARWNKSQAQLLKAQADLFKANKPKELTFPQFKGNYAENLKELKGEGFIFDDYSDTEMEGLSHKLWLLHNKNPGASFEKLLGALANAGAL